MSKSTLIKKFSDMDWDGWADTPSEEIFTNWLQKRISKKRGNYPSPKAMNIIRTHVNKLFNDHMISADDSFFAAEDRSWDSIKVAWVLRYQAQEMDGYGFGAVSACNNNVVVSNNRSTRDITLEEEMTDRSWAGGSWVK